LKKNIVTLVVLFVLALVVSFLSMFFVKKLYECPESTPCLPIGRWVWVGFPFNVVGGPFDKWIMFVANTVFYFIIFYLIYFGYSIFFRKTKKK